MCWKAQHRVRCQDRSVRVLRLSTARIIFRLSEALRNIGKIVRIYYSLSRLVSKCPEELHVPMVCLLVVLYDVESGAAGAYGGISAISQGHPADLTCKLLHNSSLQGDQGYGFGTSVSTAEGFEKFYSKKDVKLIA